MKAWTDAEQESFEERAAIMEFDGGMTRLEADVAAMHRVDEVRARRHFASPEPPAVAAPAPPPRVKGSLDWLDD